MVVVVLLVVVVVVMVVIMVTISSYTNSFILLIVQTESNCMHSVVPTEIIVFCSKQSIFRSYM